MEQIALTLLEISAASAVVIVAVWLLSPLINRSFTAKWKYWLWLVMAARLLIPFNPSFESAPARVEVSIPAAPIAIPAAAAPTAAARPAGPLPAQAAAPAAPAITTIELLMLVWMAGTAAFLLWQIAGYLLFCRRAARWGLPVPADGVAAAVRRQAEAEFGIGKEVPAIICKEVSSPMMTGFFRPLLILPHGEYGERELCYILRHEFTHFKRRDIWYKALMLLANAVHWFNPAAWLMAREASRDLELSCDAAVMAGADMDERRLYSETILACVHRELRVKTALSTHFYGGKRTLKERFANILSTKKRRTGAAAFAAALLCGGVTGGLVACGIQSEQPEQSVMPGAGTSFSLDGRQLAALYTPAEGEGFEIRLTLPEGVTIAWADDYPDYEVKYSGLSPFTPILLINGGEPAGSLFPVPYGTDDEEALAAADSSAEILPEPVFGPLTRLAPDVSWLDEWAVSLWSERGSRIVCYPTVDGTVIADCVLAYQLDGGPYFLCLSVEPGLLTQDELTGLAQSVAFSPVSTGLPEAPAARQEGGPEITVKAELTRYGGMRYRQFRELTGMEAEFYHGLFYIAPLPDSALSAVFMTDGYDAELAAPIFGDESMLRRLQGNLGSMLDGLAGEMAIEELAQGLAPENQTPNYRLEEGGGTAYYVGNRYAVIDFVGGENQAVDMQLHISLDESESAGPDCHAWLLWPVIGSNGAEGCTHTGLYHSIDSRLIDYAGQERMDAFIERYGSGEECNIVNFVDFCGIHKEEFQRLIEEYDLNRYAGESGGPGYDADIIYSGDRELIEEFYRAAGNG